MSNLQNHKFIFISGLHRSGTSILFKALRDHPDISGFRNTDSPEDEGMHLQSIYKPSGYYGGAGKFGFYSDAHLTESSSLVTDENRRKLFSEWSLYWDLSKQYLLEKSPPNLIRTRFLQAMFSNSCFIILLRHPLAASYATQAWYRKFRINWRSLSRIIEHWLVCHEIFMQDQPFLKNSILIKYEQLVANPVASINQIYGNLGIDSFPSRHKILPDVNSKYFSKWKNSIDGTLSGIFAQRMIKKFESRISRFGYSLIDLGRVDDIQD